jgi:hypothetical protein
MNHLYIIALILIYLSIPVAAYLIHPMFALILVSLPFVLMYIDSFKDR